MYKGKLCTATLIVFSFGVAVGYFAWYSLFEYPPHNYDLNFEGASWISSDSDTPSGYFIKEIDIPEEVADAWIAIAATDSSELYVNRKRIATDAFFSLNVSNIHDITGDLSYGKNLVGVHVKRWSYPGRPRLLLKGVYIDLAGKEHIFVSDDTWRVSSVSERQGQGNLRWNWTLFDHSGWNLAKVEGNPSSFPIYHSKTPPYLIGKALTGHWMCHPTPGPRTVYFVTSFSLGASAREGWLGIAGETSYNLNVNGISVEASALFERRLDIYNVAPVLHPGVNTIGIGVKSVDDTPALLVQGYIHDGSSTINLQDEAMWKVASGLAGAGQLAEFGSPEWKTPVLFARYPYPPLGILPKKDMNIEWSLSFLARRFFKLFLVLFCAILFTILLWVFVSFSHSKITNDKLLNCLFLESLLYLPSLVLLIIIYVLKYDIRLDNSYPFHIRFITLSFAIMLTLWIVEFMYLYYNMFRREQC